MKLVIVLIQVLPGLDYAEAWHFPIDHAFRVIGVKGELNRESFEAAIPTEAKQASQVKDLGGGVKAVSLNLSGLADYLKTGQAPL